MRPDKGGLDANGVPVVANPLVALPTGTGKSFSIAKFVRDALYRFPSTRAMMGTHVKELIEQNAKQMKRLWPEAPIGIYSAGLKERDSIHPILYGGVQSMVGKLSESGASIFGYRDFLIIDEAHLLNDEGRYIKLIGELKLINPYLKVIGFTATPYRTGLGLMTNGGIFTDIIYDLCTIDGFNRLIYEGYLAPLFPMPTDTVLDVSNVAKSGGEFNEKQLQAAVNHRDITFKCLKEFVAWGWDRACWLIFASGVEHAEDIAQMLNEVFHIPSAAIHAKTKNRDELVEAYKRGELRCLVNNNVLTTGFDHPPIDYIGMMRPTMSTGLWVQMLGRGTRPYNPLTADPILAAMFPAPKAFCRVMDFAGNTQRLGPINDPVVPRQRGQGPAGEAPVKQCPKCRAWNHTSARICLVCETEFAFDPNLSARASTAELIRSPQFEVESFEVQNVVMVPHVSRATKLANPGVDPSRLPYMIKVMYWCGMKQFVEHISVEGSTQFGHKGREWFRQRYGEPPLTNGEVLQCAAYLRRPKRIRVWTNTKFPSILDYEF